jgi:hypothetical protein
MLCIFFNVFSKCHNKWPRIRWGTRGQSKVSLFLMIWSHHWIINLFVCVCVCMYTCACVCVRVCVCCSALAVPYLSSVEVSWNKVVGGRLALLLDALEPSVIKELRLSSCHLTSDDLGHLGSKHTHTRARAHVSTHTHSPHTPEMPICTPVNTNIT